MVITNKIQAAKLSSAKKKSIVSYAVKHGTKVAAKKYGINENTIYYWKSIIKQGCLELLEPTVSRRSFDEDTKIKAVIEYQTGKYTKLEICNKYGIRGSFTLDRWLQRYNKPNTLTFIRKNKALGVKTTYSKDFKINFVKRVAAGESAAVVARELGVPKTTAYEWVAGGKKYGESYFEPKTQPFEFLPAQESTVQKSIDTSELVDQLTLEVEIETPDDLTAYKAKCRRLKEKHREHSAMIDAISNTLIKYASGKIEAEVKSNTLEFLDSIKKELDSKKAKSKK